MLVEPKSSATILALADLADLSAKQLEDGASIEDVIETLRAAALAVRSVVDPNDRFPNTQDAEEDRLDDDIKQADQLGTDAGDGAPDEISA